MKIWLGLIPFLLVIGIMPVFADNEFVSIPPGVGSPGCEETNECFSPYEVIIDVGVTVTWSNDDSAAHTVTSGSAADGPSGVFASSLIMKQSTFSHTFDGSGTFPYFCMVHPWQVGYVVVNDISPSIIKVTVEEGQEIPGVGKTITIKVSGVSGTVEFEIIASDGEIIETLSFRASNHGEVNLPWIIPKETASGIYTVKVTDAFSSGETEIVIGLPNPLTLQEKYDKLLDEHTALQQQYDKLKSIFDELKRLFSLIMNS